MLADELPAPAAPVLGHGGFRAGQVIVSQGGLVVLDTDGLRRCDPGCDLGNVLAFHDNTLTSTGTALDVSVANVRANRAVFVPRTTLPISGMRNRNA